MANDEHASLGPRRETVEQHLWWRCKTQSNWRDGRLGDALLVGGGAGARLLPVWADCAKARPPIRHGIEATKPLWDDTFVGAHASRTTIVIMKLMQCWDDGVTTDVRLVSLLRRHGARATFNLNAGLHLRERQFGWLHRSTEVWRLGHEELREVYGGFSVANHTLTHPHLEQLPIDAARREIRDGRSLLQELFDQPVDGFVYPFGTFDDAVAQAVRDAGHLYARTTHAAEAGVGTIDAMAVAPSCHFLAPDFWQRLDRARPTGVFWFWGHSYELVDEAMWTAFEASLARLCAEPGIQWCDPTDLFDGDNP